jgi:hypothetical protein
VHHTQPRVILVDKNLLLSVSTVSPAMVLPNASYPKYSLALVVFVVMCESIPIHAADLQARLQLRRCVSLTSNIDSREQLHKHRNTGGSAAYLPAHSPLNHEGKSHPEFTSHLHSICDELAGLEQQRRLQEFTRIQTQLFPNIRF